MLEDGKFAFEIQFSSQTDAIWKERTIKYEELGIKPVWILGYKESIEDLLVSGNFYDSEICEDARINLGLTKSNAGIRINDLPQDLYFLRKNYLSEYQNRQIFHILTVVKGNCKLYLGYLRPTSKTKFYGTVIQLGELWKFSSKYVRFLPSIEILFNDKEKLKHQHIEAQTDLRKELHDKILEYTKCTSLYEIPEIAAQTMGNSPYKLKVFSIEYKINSVKDRLLAEIAIYEKFVKRKQKGDSFTFTKEVYEFLEKWGFITEENKQSLKPQMGNFLNNLRSLGILEKQGDSKIWIVTGKKLLDM